MDGVREKKVLFADDVIEQTQVRFLKALKDGTLSTIDEGLKSGINANTFFEENLQRPVHIAACIGSTRVILRLAAEKDFEVDALNGHGSTALMVATEAGQVYALETLLRLGAKVDKTDAFKKTTLQRAIVFGHYDCAKVLLKHGANVNHFDIFEATPLATALFKQTKPRILNLLYYFGADADARTGYSMSAFLEFTLFAHKQEHVDLIKFLIKHGSDVNQIEPIGQRSALHLVALTGYIDLAIELLNANANRRKRDCFQRTPRDIARLHGNYNMAIILGHYVPL